MTPDALELLILEAGDPSRLQEALAILDEKQRAALSTAAQRIFNQLQRNKANESASDRLKRFIAQRGDEAYRYWNSEAARHATLALFGLCPISVLKKPDVYFWQDQADLDRIVRDRQPEWLDDWVAHELEREFSQLNFPTLRGWIRDGVCGKPTVDGYYRKFATHLMRTGLPNRGESVPPITVQLLDDPDLLDDIEGLFRVENIALNTNSWLRTGAGADYETWTDALIKLAAQGTVERAHLLDLALEGLTRDLKQNQLSGFHGFYKRMAPDAGERLRHQQRYIDLLCHPVGHVVKFAIEMLAELEKKDALDTAPVVREIQAVFTSEGKGNAISALKLINRIITRQKGFDPAPVDAVCEALRHVHPDVQAQALTILEAHVTGLGEARLDALRDLESFVSASNRGRITALVATLAGTPPGRSSVGKAVEPDSSAVAATRQDALSYRAISDDINVSKVLCPENAVEPIDSIDALLDAVFHAVEVVESPDEIERIVDAISRLADDRIDDFDARVSPLLHRIQTGRTGSNGLVIGAGIGVAILDLLYTWLTGRLHLTKRENQGYYEPEDAFGPVIVHLRAISDRVARKQAQVLLSAPTHKGGWIDPLLWLDRLRAVQSLGGIAEGMDFRLSLLRLAPDNREVALAQAATLEPQVRRIVQFALGGDELPTRSDRGNHAAWITAARCREPRKDWSVEFAALDLDDRWPDGLRPAHYDWRSSHKAGQYEKLRWKTPRLEVSYSTSGEAMAAKQAGGLLARLLQSVSGRISTDWAALPTAALNRRTLVKHYWSGDLNTIWVTQWLAYLWPQHPAAAHIKGALKLVQRMDENSSNWTPSSGFFQALFQANRPWLEPGHLLLCLGLIAKDADAKGLAVDALIEGISGRLFDPKVFADVMARIGEGEWIKLNRLNESLMRVLPVSGLHAAVVSSALQEWLPQIDLRQKNAFHVLEILVEAQALAERPLSKEADDALRSLDGSGKAAKLAKQLLSQ